jgi:excisionase family DNA binding protein
VTLTLQEAADRLGVHYMTVYRWVRTGKLPATKQGASWSVRQSDLDALSEPAKVTPRSGRVDHGERLARRLTAGDEAGAMAVAEAALAGGMEPDALYLDVLAGAMVTIGDGWHAGTISVAEEHQATAIMQRLLGRLARNFTRRGRRRGTIVLGAAAGDPHGLPGAFLADPLRGRGYNVVDLGPDTPAEAFVHAATHADGLVAVGMTLSLDPTDPVREAIAALRSAEVTARIVVGGAAIADAEVAAELGADGWAADGWAALALLTATA